VVECELVLWGAPPDGVNKGPGRKVKETFVFVSPQIKTGELIELSEGNEFWPAEPESKKPISSRKSWKLSHIKRILSSLESQTLRGNLAESKAIKQK
ncbi:MAG: hypothetical protein ACRD5H_09075, partial [Nitrososphaerales archaeon]